MKLIRSYLTYNPCYQSAQKLTVKGLMLHSVGCSQPKADVFIKKWDHPAAKVCVHAIIDGISGTVYQTLPWDHRASHCGGSGNNAYIGVEMCEPDSIRYVGDCYFECADREAAAAVARRTYAAAVGLFAMLCRAFGLDPLADGVILSHSEAHARGIASDHKDPDLFWSQLGIERSMDGFRADVSRAMQENSSPAALMWSVPDKKAAELSFPVSMKRSDNVKKIYFTFDDGPSDMTELLLAILRRHHVKATFFVTNLSRRPDILKKIAEEGHTIGLHSYTHDYETVYSSPEGYFDDLQRIDDFVYETVGLRSKLVRLPGGSKNTVHRQYCEGIIPVILSGLQEKGYRVFDWDCDNNDGTLFHLPPKAYFRYFLNTVSDREELIFLSHCRDEDDESIRSLDMILDFCEKNGWETDTIENYDGPAMVNLAQKREPVRQGHSNPYLMLVNPQNMMDWVKAGKLKLVTYEDIEGIPIKIEVNTLIAYLKMKYELARRGILIGIRSAFRLVAAQRELWYDEMAKDDYDPDTFMNQVALPWMSEHHTGLAIDILLKEGDEWPEFLSDEKREAELFSVIHRICPRFGFIVRYPQGKEAITGYRYKPWHLRYVGIKHAKAMTRNGLTLEEYKELLPEDF